MTDSTNPIGEKEIREIMQQELIDRVQLLQRKTSSAGLRLQVPGTETFIFAGSAAWIAKNLPDASTTPIASPVSAEQPGASKITDTASARAYVDAWHRKHFLTDRTFSRYIMADPARSNPLAGDFAWQPAKALESMEAARLASQSQAVPVIPSGWQVRKDADGTIVVQNPKRGGCALGGPYDNPENIEHTIFYAFLDAHLAATQQGREAQADVPVIGRMLDEFSELPVLWGLNEPGALMRHSDVFKMIVNAGKTYLAPAAQASPNATLPNAEVLADEAALYRDLTGAAMKLGYDGIPAALEALRGVVAQEGEMASVQVKHGQVLSIEITLRQAKELVECFGGCDAEVSIIKRPDAWADMPDGLYAYFSEYPDEGSMYLGPTEVDDELAMNGEPTASAQAAAEVRNAALEEAAGYMDTRLLDRDLSHAIADEIRALRSPAGEDKAAGQEGVNL